MSTLGRGGSGAHGSHRSRRQRALHGFMQMYETESLLATGGRSLPAAHWRVGLPPAHGRRGLRRRRHGVSDRVTEEEQAETLDRQECRIGRSIR